MQRADASRTDLKGMLPAEMETFVADLGEPSYRARQIFDWVYNKGVAEVEEMTNLSKSFRTALGRVAFITRLRSDAWRGGASSTAFHLGSAMRRGAWSSEQRQNPADSICP